MDAKTTRTPAGSLQQQPRSARSGSAAAAPGTPVRSAPARPGVPPSRSAPARPGAAAGLIIGALVCFIIAKAHEPYIAITVLEIFIVLFFILIYMLTLHHLLVNLDWSLLDLVNSFITAVFLLIVAILAMQEMERRHLFYVGGTQCLTAAIVCILDAVMVTKKMRDKMRRILGLDFESSSSLLLEPKKSPWPARPAPLLRSSRCDGAARSQVRRRAGERQALAGPGGWLSGISERVGRWAAGSLRGQACPGTAGEIGQAVRS
uniref:MARVEL domain-containing protein n=1 Tax=Ursus americanus TaxID=9643 RepID=A0A452RXJ2_URSAM